MTTELDQAAKLRVIAAMLRQADTELQALQQTVGEEHDAAELDEDSAYSNDDVSQSDEAGELKGRIGAYAEADQQALDALHRRDWSLTDVVGEGAIVGFDGDRYVIGAVVGSFECDGATYEGLSLDAPIYEPLAGLRAGDTFTFRGAEHTVDLVV
jgi:transcription elongation GreA/GreB family factor